MITAKKDKFDSGVKKLHEVDQLSDYLGELKNSLPYNRLREIREMESPYSCIREIDGLLDLLKEEETKIIDEEKSNLLTKAEKSFQKLQNVLKDKVQLLKEVEEKSEEFKKELV